MVGWEEGRNQRWSGQNVIGLNIFESLREGGSSFNSTESHTGWRYPRLFFNNNRRKVDSRQVEPEGVGGEEDRKRGRKPMRAEPDLGPPPTGRE